MKRKHTEKKSANRSFDTKATGFPSESYRKQMNKVTYSPDKTDPRFTKAKPKRKRNVKTHIKKK